LVFEREYLFLHVGGAVGSTCTGRGEQREHCKNEKCAKRSHDIPPYGSTVSVCSTGKSEDALNDGV
jgi:hypothetical protein